MSDEALITEHDFEVLEDLTMVATVLEQLSTKDELPFLVETYLPSICKRAARTT
jgi:hypothetical protein